MTVFLYSHLSGSELPAVNVATLSRGAKCIAASSSEDTCDQVIDGRLLPVDGAWLPQGEVVGAHLTLELGTSYTLVGARVMPNVDLAGQIKTINISFDDGSSQSVREICH